VHGVDVRQISLVVLDHEWNGMYVHSVLAKVLFEIGKRLEVLIPLPAAGGRHQDDAIRALEHELSRGVVIDLAGHGIDLELRGHARDGPEVEGQKIEEERAITFGRNGSQLAHVAPGSLAVYHLEVRGLAAQAGSVIDHL